MDFKEKYSRLLSIYGEQALSSLQNSHVAICGLGGVGSYCATALARCGIKKITIIDFDKIEQSNINRQEFATEKTIGQKKVDLAEKFIAKIDKDIKVYKHDVKISADNIDNLFNDVNYIVDAIDDVNGKIALAKYAQNNNVKIVSCMGTALRTDPFQLKFEDIYNTNTCPLCKAFRKRAKEEGITKLEVLYSAEPAIKTNSDTLGSTSYLPPIAGLMLAYKVCSRLS